MGSVPLTAVAGTLATLLGGWMVWRAGRDGPATTATDQETPVEPSDAGADEALEARQRAQLQRFLGLIVLAGGAGLLVLSV